MRVITTGSEDDDSPKIDGATLQNLLNSALNTHGMPMTRTFNVMGIEFEIRSLDHGETGQVNHAVQGIGDIFYREIEVQRRMLARAIAKINGQPVQSVAVLEDFIRACPPAMVNAMFWNLQQLRLSQETTIERVSEDIKKKQGYPSSESDGDLPKSSEPSHGIPDSTS